MNRYAITRNPAPEPCKNYEPIERNPISSLAATCYYCGHGPSDHRPNIRKHFMTKLNEREVQQEAAKITKH